MHVHHPYHDDYYTGRVYFRPHRHFHVMYTFPIWTGSTVAYRPFAYCNGRLFEHDDRDRHDHGDCRDRGHSHDRGYPGHGGSYRRHDDDSDSD
jgi:hypothetical protein